MALMNWIKNIFTPSIIEKAPVEKDKIKILSEREQSLKQESKPFCANTDWFKIIPSSTAPKNIQVFLNKPFQKVLTLRDLNQERIRKEKERMQKLKDNALHLIEQINFALKQANVSEAEEMLGKLNNIHKALKGDEFKQTITNLVKLVNELKTKIEKREEKKRNRERDKEVQILQAQQERERKKCDVEERKRRLELEECERKKSVREKLVRDITQKKNDSQQVAKVLSTNAVEYFYHFTSTENLQSIKDNKGLYSWAYCKKNKIIISKQGGDDQSIKLDSKYHLEDYVRLSFCSDHPMAYRCHQRLLSDIVLLKIRIDVAQFKDTIFSDINATDKNHIKGDDADFLNNNIDFRAVKRKFVKRKDPDFSAHQAEVLVKTHIPIDYIVNISCPTRLY